MNSLRSIFQNKTQLDVITVLLLLGEATIWKAIWSRFRSTRSIWKQWVVSVSPGWTPLAATIFAALNGANGPPNLIFNRTPEGISEDGLLLTNLNSGATHNASNVILQNIWQVWEKGPRQQSKSMIKGSYNTQRDVGIVDVDISALKLQPTWAVGIHGLALAIQMGVSLGLSIYGLSLEVFISFCIALAGQFALLLSITPRKEAWYHRQYRIHRSCPVMLHRGLDSTEVLFVRKAVLDGVAISLEEFCWSSQAVRNNMDFLAVVMAGLSFLVLTFQIICIGWMSSQSKVLYLILGGLGLVANVVEASTQPEWQKNFDNAYSGVASCAPTSSTLMGAVGVLLAAKYPASDVAAKLLYPDNHRFDESRVAIDAVLDQVLCANCRQKFKDNDISRQCLHEQEGNATNACFERLWELVPGLKIQRQTHNAIYTVARYLDRSTTEERVSQVQIKEEVTRKTQYSWV